MRHCKNKYWADNGGKDFYFLTTVLLTELKYALVIIAYKD